MQENELQNGDWRHRLSDAAARAVFGFILKLPYQRRIALMGRWTRRYLGPIAGYTKRAEENLKMIYPDMEPVARQQIVNACLDNFGRTIIENYSNVELGQRLRGQTLAGPGLVALERARAEGRPVLFLTGHFGNYEVPRQILTNMGYSIGGIYRSMRNPYFNAHYVQTMQRVSGPVFERGRRGTMGFVKHLKAGGMATLLFDIHEVGGTPIRFLGRPAFTSLAAAEMALKYDALLIPYFATRNADGFTFNAVLEEPIAPSTPLEMMTEATRRLEAHVQHDPEQWFWIHRRWKDSNR